MSETTNKSPPGIHVRAVRMFLDNPGQNGSRCWQGGTDGSTSGLLRRYVPQGGDLGLHARRDPKRSFGAVGNATFGWVDRFNNRRLLEPIGNVPAAEAETDFSAALDAEAVAA